MRRWIHRIRHGHWPFWSRIFWETGAGLVRDDQVQCLTCIDDMLDDQRRLGGGGW